MKKILFCLLIYFVAMNGNAMSFTIQGKIEGLMPGDTLYFEKVTLPGFILDFAFKVIVEQPNEFTFSGSHEHVGYYMMTYKPVSGIVVPGDMRGLTMLIKDGTTRLIGTTDQIYYSRLEGGLYDNDTLQEVMQLGISLGKERSGLLRLAEEARIADDLVRMREYGDKFNSFHFERREDFQRLSQLWNEFYEKYPSSEHTIVAALQRVISRPLETSLSGFEKMNEEARNSHFGKLLKQEIDRMTALQPGNNAPDFHLIAIDGREITLVDCAGSYVLIYHWGLCPGSLQINGQVIDLHNRFKEHLIVIGITNSIERIRNLYDNTSPDDKFMHLELKPILANMLAHSWFEAETTIGNNGKITADYAIAGLPFFVFISPDGKIIARGFSPAFFEAKNIMEAEFGE
jgi:hypothetical protein